MWADSRHSVDTQWALPYLTVKNPFAMLFMPRMPMFCLTSSGTTSFKAPVVGIHHIQRNWTASNLNPARLQLDEFGVLCAVKPMYRSLPASRASIKAAFAPSSSNTRCGSSYRMISWCWTRSMQSTCRRCSDSSSCLAASCLSDRRFSSSGILW